MGHGYEDRLTIEGNKASKLRLMNAEDINSFMSKSKEKEKWADMQDNGGTFISYACASGVEGGIIQDLSKNEENSEMVFVAPTKFVHPAKDTKNGKVFTFTGNDEGEWNIYKGGKLVGTRPNGWQPVEIDLKTFEDKSTLKEQSK